MNYVIHPETEFAQNFIHLVKGDKKIVWQKYSSNELGRLAQGVGNSVPGSKQILFVPKSQI